MYQHGPQPPAQFRRELPGRHLAIVAPESVIVLNRPVGSRSEPVGPYVPTAQSQLSGPPADRTDCTAQPFSQRREACAGRIGEFQEIILFGDPCPAPAPAITEFAQAQTKPAGAALWKAFSLQHFNQQDIAMALPGQFQRAKQLFIRPAFGLAGMAQIEQAGTANHPRKGPPDQTGDLRHRYPSLVSCADLGIFPSRISGRCLFAQPEDPSPGIDGTDRASQRCGQIRDRVFPIATGQFGILPFKPWPQRMAAQTKICNTRCNGCPAAPQIAG